MDLNEHALTEAQRTLKRLGITHLLRSNVALREETQPPHPLPLPAPTPQNNTQNSAPQKPSTAENEPLPLLLRSLFHGKQSPVRTLWTYAGLYQDMQTATNSPRLVVFKKIQESVCQHLQWQIKDICSWPLDLDVGTFRKGLEFFKPRIIIFFQNSEASNNQPNNEGPLTLAQVNSRVVTLPSLEEMAKGNQQIKNEAWKILQKI